MHAPAQGDEKLYIIITHPHIWDLPGGTDHASAASSIWNIKYAEVLPGY